MILVQLRELTAGYLRAEGYDVRESEMGQLVGSRQGLGGNTDFLYVWVPDIPRPAEFRHQAGPLLDRFAEADRRHPGAQKFMVVDSTEGIGSDFRSASRKLRVLVRVPVQFFDTDFRWEADRETATATRDLRDRGSKLSGTRVPQPYSRGGHRGEDLLANLRESLRDPMRRGPSVHFVVGPAGIGKSVLFASLFAGLLDDFLRDKQAQLAAARPLALLPEHVMPNEGGSIRTILRSFLSSEFTRPLDLPVFNWRMTHKWAVWLIDGLDEVIARDTGFFDDLDELLTTPGGSAPSVVVCIRQSLLATSNELAAFIEDRRQDVDVYELARWGPKSKRAFALINLGDRADAFLDSLRARSSLDDLATLPYYCDLLSKEFRHGAPSGELTQSGLLELALSSIIRREYEKHLLDAELMPEDEVRAFLVEVARLSAREPTGGVSLEALQETAAIAAPSDMPDAEMARTAQNLTQIALFARIGQGRVGFEQEVMEQYLFGKWLVANIALQPQALLSALSARPLPNDSVAVAVFADHIRSTSALSNLKELIARAVGRPIEYRNLVMLAAKTATGSALRDLVFERQDLSGVVFDQLDLHGVSFRGSDLTDAEFRRCDLRGCTFGGAMLRGTTFNGLEPKALEGASIDDMGGFFSIRVERSREITDLEEAGTWFAKRTGNDVSNEEPCPSALQLRHLFGKFVHLDGSPRRMQLDRSGLIRGRVIADPEGAFLQSGRFGYLVERPHERYERPAGDKYAEMVGYVTGLRLTPGVSGLLDAICERVNCKHVPNA